MVNLTVVGRKITKIFGPKEPITFFEVKELYNLAYEHKAQARNALRKYRRLEAQAQAMDEAYRAQLGLGMRRAA